MDTGQKLGSALEDLKGHAKSHYEDIKETAKERACQAMEKSRRGIEGRPFTAIAVAFASGVVLGSLCRRTHR